MKTRLLIIMLGVIITSFMILNPAHAESYTGLQLWEWPIALWPVEIIVGVSTVIVFVVCRIRK